MSIKLTSIKLYPSNHVRYSCAVSTSLTAPTDVAAAAATSATTSPELAALAQLAAAGVRLAPLRVVPSTAEETFYRLNNLPAQLSALFAGLDLANPDEDDLEELAPDAQVLLRQHFLLDEFVDLFYAGLANLPARLRVRRPNMPGAEGTGAGGGAAEEGRVVTKGRPALLALKDTWADDWSFDALWARTTREGTVALSAQPVILAPPTQTDAGDAEAGHASQLLRQRVRLLHDPALGMTGVRFL